MSIESFNSPPSPESETDTEPELESSAWDKVRKATKVAALGALLSVIPTQESAAQATQNNSPETSQENTEWVLENEADMSQVLSVAREQGIEGSISGQPATRIQLESGSVITIAYAGGQPDFLLLSGGSGKVVMFDSEVDGDIDKFVVNQASAELGDNQRQATSQLYALQNIDQLADRAETVSDLRPEDVSVFAFDSGDGTGPAVKVVNFSTGETKVVTGQAAGELIQASQNFYTKQIEIDADEVVE